MHSNNPLGSLRLLEAQCHVKFFFSFRRVASSTSQPRPHWLLLPVAPRPAQRPSYLTGISDRPTNPAVALEHRACSLGYPAITLSLVLTPTLVLPSAEEIHLLNTYVLRRNNSKHRQLLNVFPSALLPTGQSYHSPVL
jgi:hypothetical protein